MQVHLAKERPALAFWIAALLAYGWLLSFQFPPRYLLDGTGRDIWQHLAALHELLLHPLAPANPFVAGSDPSRLYGPVHVALGLIGHGLGWTQLDAYAAASVLALALLAAGQWAFARAYFASPWAPLLLLAVTLFGWAMPFSFPGVNSPFALVFNSGIPATIAIGAGLLGWAWTIRLLRHWSPAELGGFALFTAAMFANHQLGAGIVLIGCGCFWLAGPAPWRHRIGLAAAVMAGLALSAAWPYFNPWTVFLTAGRASWGTDYDFYAPATLARLLVPAALGVFGLRRPLVITAVVYFSLYAIGLLGNALAHRFLAPGVVVLQIGLVQLMLDRRALWPLFAGTAMLLVAVHGLLLSAMFDGDELTARRNGDYLRAAAVLLRDRPAGIAADHAAAWPVVANGIKVYVTPFPETLIPDQDRRWHINPRLFAATTPPADRLALACRLGVRVLIADRGELAVPAQRALAAEAARTTRAGPLLRYDLPPCPQRAGPTRSNFPSASSVSR